MGGSGTLLRMWWLPLPAWSQSKKSKPWSETLHAHYILRACDMQHAPLAHSSMCGTCCRLQPLPFFTRRPFCPARMAHHMHDSDGREGRLMTATRRTHACMYLGIGYRVPIAYSIRLDMSAALSAKGAGSWSQILYVGLLCRCTCQFAN